MIQLSASKLNVFNDCPRCFWDAENRKTPRLRGIFPSLPSGMDKATKIYFDQFRGSLPPELEGEVTGVLFEDLDTLTKWRHWRSGLVYENSKVRLIGALDDVIVDGSSYIPLDYKTKGSAPKDDGSQYYQTQLDCYDLLLSENSFPTKGLSYLVYMWPVEIKKFESIGFKTKVYPISCSKDRARKLLDRAVKVLGGERPEASPNCEYCSFVENKKRI